MSVYFYKRTERWCITIQRGGKRISRYAEKGSTKDDAIQYEAKLLREYFLSDKLGKTTDRSIAEAIQRWLAEEVAHYKSKEKTTSHILQLTDFVLGRTVSEIHVVAEEYA